MELELKSVDLTSLVQRKMAFDMYQKVTFINNYEWILNLLTIPIDDHMLISILHFWDRITNAYYLRM